MKNLKLSAPWVLFYREIEAMFGADPDVRVAYDEEENIVRLYVDGEEKAEAIEKLLPREAKLSCPRLYSHLLAKLTLRDFRPPRSPHQFNSVQSLSRLVVSYSATP